LFGPLTLFDIATVACFVGLVAAFFLRADGDLRQLPHFLVCGVAFAVANQLGNKELPVLGAVVLAAGVVYAVILCRR
jgi:hypothetical protein